MTKREMLIQQVRNGEIAILNDGTFEQLKSVKNVRMQTACFMAVKGRIMLNPQRQWMRY